MQLRTRFVLFITFSALAPLAVLGLVANQVSTTRLLSKVAEVQARTASSMAAFTESWLEVQLGLLAAQVATYDVSRLDDELRTGLLQAVYLQTPGAQVVALVDEGGVDLSPSVFLTAPGRGALADRDVVDEARFARFRTELDEVRRITPPGRVSYGDPYLPPGREVPVVVLVARLDGGTALGVELDLTPLAQRFRTAPDSSERIVLLDAAQRAVLGEADLVDASTMQALPQGALVDELRYPLPDGIEVLAAVAPVADTPWRVVVAEPTSTTLEPAREISTRTAFVAGWAAVFSVVLGILMSRQITGPVLSLRDAALSVAEGDYGRRVEGAQGPGELTELTHAFNFMSRKLDLDRETIAAKNAEIEAFNRELQDRVEQRTRQLREAQDQLVRSARLAAVGEMGAGLAHELNNPLAGILGLAQVLVAKADPAGSQHGMLRSIEEQARRCTQIVAQLQRFSDTGADPASKGGGVATATGKGASLDPAEADVVDLGAVVEEVLGLVRGSFQDRGVAISHDLEAALSVHGERGALAQAMVQLLTSVRAAAPPGARVHVHGSIVDKQVELALALDAQGGADSPGLRIGKDDWMASGMGFWAARRVLADHSGVLLEPELPAEGTARSATWRIRLPRA